MVLSTLRSDSEWFILGDFNICLKEKNLFFVKKYEQILYMFNLKQIIVDPTRITNMSASLLDHILCSHQDKILQSGTLPIGLSDHLFSVQEKCIKVNSINIIQFPSDL